MSYRGAWDGGPPGAEAEYAPPSLAPPLPPAAPALPATDPWTGVSYTQYAAPYDYQAYGAAAYNYGYDPGYYQRPADTYYDKYQDTRAYPPQGYNYPPRPRSPTKSPVEPRHVEKKRRSYSSSSSDYGKYSRKRDHHEEERKRRSHSRSEKSKRAKYSSSDRSSSRSSSRSSRKVKKSRRRSSSSSSNRSYKRNKSRKIVSRDRSYTPPLKKSMSRSRNRSDSRQPPTKEVSRSRSRQRREREIAKGKGKSHSIKDKGKEKKSRDVFTPPRKIKEEVVTPPRGSKASSITPPRSYIKTEKPDTPPPRRGRAASPRKGRDSSLTPPKSYARSRSSSSSKSRSPSLPPAKAKSRRRARSSSGSSRSSGRSWASLKRRGKSASKHRSRTKSRSKRRSPSKSRSPSRRRSRSRKRTRTPRSRSKSRSRSNSSGRSHSGSPGEERRGQFTVADRKRFWKLHRSRQEEKQRERPDTPPKEVKPPPGAIEPDAVDDIEYGDPPEVEGPNFAELLPAAPPALASSSRRPGPLPIKNDGSFLEMFKKMQEETKKIEEQKKPEIKKPVLPFIGKRRGGRVLKTGLVKKAKAIEEQLADNAPKDAWSLYMQEVKKYRETSCEEERKTRPLVK